MKTCPACGLKHLNSTAVCNCGSPITERCESVYRPLPEVPAEKPPFVARLVLKCLVVALVAAAILVFGGPAAFGKALAILIALLVATCLWRGIGSLLSALRNRADQRRAQIVQHVCNVYLVRHSAKVPFAQFERDILHSYGDSDPTPSSTFLPEILQVLGALNTQDEDGLLLGCVVYRALIAAHVYPATPPLGPMSKLHTRLLKEAQVLTIECLRNHPLQRREAPKP